MHIWCLQEIVVKAAYDKSLLHIQEDLFNISSSISGSPINYSIKYASNIFSSTVTFNSTVDLSSCKEDIGCEVQLPSSYCSQSTIINVTISATNILGEGPPSNPFTIGS